MNPFHNRPEEWRLYNPLDGVRTMLELGNKKNREITYKSYFESLGIEHISVDWNGLDGALKLDLTKPLNLGTFDMVSNIGTTEHVAEQEPVWRNILEAMHVGSILVSVTPSPGGKDWWWHGKFYPEMQFYGALVGLNGLKLERLYEAGEHPRKCLYARMVRERQVDFSMPQTGMWVNPRGKVG